MVEMADHGGNHRCLVEKNVPIAFILPSRWQDSAESLGMERTSCLWFTNWQLQFVVIFSESQTADWNHRLFYATKIPSSLHCHFPATRLGAFYTCISSKIMTRTRLGDLLHFGQLFKAFSNNHFAQIFPVFMQFYKVVEIFHFAREINFGQLL